uniref:Uncharacterized protein n=8 Tax=Enterobacterales TaxID=91347 RepID=T2FKF5_ECOLX|nr:hypothetical protein pHKU1_60 [Escherichia coli]AIW55640.1 hypothetical protein [Klebsiella pneumoniae]AJQ17171.1 hypothetical protein [Morganella morganii]AMW88406.1 hypothetical protein [Enterobacter cloacae]AMW88473.1 hypothetical protein [Citrobacter freundii]ASD49128.1 hypothetical protein [Klebsiella oxytoca]AVE17860.1 hypothetical protein [Enterobacter hormaechei]CZR15136.1 hypothetical protein [Yersinia pseudotuberculosis]
MRSGRRAPARGYGGPPAGRGAVLRVSGRRAAGYGGHRTVTASAPLSCTIHG